MKNTGFNTGILVLLAMFFLLAHDSFARNYDGKKAEQFIGILREKLTAKPYYYIPIQRRNRDPVHDFSDAILFTPLSSHYTYIRRLDEDHRLLINAAKPQQEAVPVQEKDITGFEKIIKANHMNPYIIQNKKHEELAIIYCTLKPCFIYDSQEKNGQVMIELKGNIFDLRQEIDSPFIKFRGKGK